MTPGERILITGGSGGMGGAIAAACAARGAWPVVGYHTGEVKAQEMVARCGRGEVWRGDLRFAPDQVPVVDAIVHAAAAFSPDRSLFNAPCEVIDDQLSVNVLGPLRLTRAVRAASAGLRRIVFVLSSASFCRGTGPYALSKAAELALCRLLANELEPSGVRVDAIVPGWTATAMAERAARAKGLTLAEVAQDHLGGTLLDPREIGQLAAELLFDHADAPPGNLIVWDRRDSVEPVWHALNQATPAAVNNLPGGWASRPVTIAGDGLGRPSSELRR